MRLHFSLLFHARMPKLTNLELVVVGQVWSSCSKECSHYKSLQVNPYKEALNLIIAFINNLWKQLWSVNLDISRSIAPQNGFEFGRPLLEGNMGDQKMLHLFSLPSYVQNYCLINILDGCLVWKRFEYLSLWCQRWLWKIGRGKYGRSKQAVSVFFVHLRLESLSN